jgi:hypothetical protein
VYLLWLIDTPKQIWPLRGVSIRPEMMLPIDTTNNHSFPLEFNTNRLSVRLVGEVTRSAINCLTSLIPLNQLGLVVPLLAKQKLFTTFDCLLFYSTNSHDYSITFTKGTTITVYHIQPRVGAVALCTELWSVVARYRNGHFQHLAEQKPLNRSKQKFAQNW